MPKEPFHPFQFLLELLAFVLRWDAFGHLPQDGETHGNVEPIQDMFCQWAVTFGEISKVVSPIGEERNGLVHLQPLSLQHLKESSPRLTIVAGDQSKPGCGSLSRRAFSHNHFKRSILAAIL